MPNRFSRRFALGLSLLCLSPLARGEDKEILTPVGVPGTPMRVQAPLSPEEMKAAGERATLAAEKLGWRIGCQAWTFNKRTLFDTIDQVNALGLHYLEAFPGQIVDQDKNMKMGPGLSTEAKQAIKKKLADAHITLVSFGVTGIPADEAGARKFFEWAKEMGLETIVTEPNENQFDVLNKLVDEFGINVALHNHPNPSHYWNPDTVLKVTKGLSKRIGACCDTGHWPRSGLNAIECLKKLEGRIISFHFKDLNKQGNEGHDVPWGTGINDVKGMLTEVKRQGVKAVFSVEYEYKMENSMPEITQCVAYFDKVCGELAG